MHRACLVSTNVGILTSVLAFRVLGVDWFCTVSQLTVYFSEDKVEFPTFIVVFDHVLRDSLILVIPASCLSQFFLLKSFKDCIFSQIEDIQTKQTQKYHLKLIK